MGRTRSGVAALGVICVVVGCGGGEAPPDGAVDLRTDTSTACTTVALVSRTPFATT